MKYTNIRTLDNQDVQKVRDLQREEGIPIGRTVQTALKIFFTLSEEERKEILSRV